MIYTLGCSFTKWHWPTWSDWLEVYSNQPVTNWGYPGFTNELIYQTLLANIDNIKSTDHVYIMWTGNNRSCNWYDQEWVDQHQCRDFFPEPADSLWLGSGQPWQGLYKTHPDQLPSLTHMIVNNFNIMFNTQLLLKNIGCKYTMMFWQNPWLDTRETFKPSFSMSWNLKQHITSAEVKLAKNIMSMPTVTTILKHLDWSHFVDAPADVLNPAQYQGMWEFGLSRPEFLDCNHHSDHHPNTFTHHEWLTNKMLVGNSQHESQAHDLALTAKALDIPNWSGVDALLGHGRILNKFPLKSAKN
jgi:hypothetical protein